MTRDKNSSSNRSVQVGGNLSDSVVITGDHNTTTVHIEKVTLPPADSIDISQEISLLGETLSQLQSSNQIKIDNAVSDVEHELAQSTPDKDEIGKALERALDYAKKAEGFTQTIEKIKPHVTNIAAWLGENWYKLLAAVGLAV